MESQHLRHFVAVAEKGSLTVAAPPRPFWCQPRMSVNQSVKILIATKGIRKVDFSTPCSMEALVYPCLAVKLCKGSSS